MRSLDFLESHAHRGAAVAALAHRTREAQDDTWSGESEKILRFAQNDTEEAQNDTEEDQNDTDVKGGQRCRWIMRTVAGTKKTVPPFQNFGIDNRRIA